MHEIFLPQFLEEPSQRAERLPCLGPQVSHKVGSSTEPHVWLLPTQTSPGPAVLRPRLSFDGQSPCLSPHARCPENQNQRLLPAPCQHTAGRSGAGPPGCSWFSKPSPKPATGFPAAFLLQGEGKRGKDLGPVLRHKQSIPMIWVYQVPANTELATTEPLLLGEVRIKSLRATQHSISISWSIRILSVRVSL